MAVLDQFADEDLLLAVQVPGKELDQPVEVEGHLRAYRGVVCPGGRLLVPHFLWRPQLRDPNDELILEAAVIGSFNQRDFLPAAGRFGIAVLPPAEVLRRIQAERPT